MRPYYFPTEADFIQKQDIITSYRTEISLLETDIDQEKKSLEDAVRTLNESFRPSIESLKDIISQKQEELAALEAKNHLSETDLKRHSEQKIDVWEKRREELQQKMEEEKASVAPIRRLPSELLSEIFLWAKLVVSPWVVTKVCKSWRAVALRTPRLWNRITIIHPKACDNHYYYAHRTKLPPTGPYQVSRLRESITAPDQIVYQSDKMRTDPNQICGSLNGLQKALDLSGNSPLHITLSISPYIFDVGATEEKQREERSDIIGLMIRHFSRCRALTILDLPAMRYLQSDRIADQLKDMDLSALEELEIYTRDNMEIIESILHAAKRTARRISRLTTAFQYSTKLHPTVKLRVHHLQNLTYLCVGKCLDIPFEGDKDIWPVLINLKDLEFQGHDLTTWSAACLPSLERLAICAGSFTDLGGILPTVKFLYLQDVSCPSTRPIILAPVLESLIVLGRNVATAKAIEAPKLNSLHIYYTGARMNIQVSKDILGIWEPSPFGPQRAFLNPRQLTIVIPHADSALVKALRSMYKIQDLVVAIRGRSNVGNKLIEDLSFKPSASVGKGKRNYKSVVCPNLKTFEVFRTDQYGKPSPWEKAEERIQLRNLMNDLKSARPTLVCRITHDHVDEDWFTS